MNDRGRTAGRLSHLRCPVPVVTIGELEPLADIVVECAPANCCPIAEPFLQAGKTGIVLSAGAILSHEHFIDLARRTGGRGETDRRKGLKIPRWQRRVGSSPTARTDIPLKNSLTAAA
jgi:hypothetical protein